MNRKRALVPPSFLVILLGAAALLLFHCAGSRAPVERGPFGWAGFPPGLSEKQKPQFVYFTSDDNGFSGLPESGSAGGLHFLTELFAQRRNPAGSGNPETFDGAALHFTFFVNTFFIASVSGSGPISRKRSGEAPVLIKRAWKEAVDQGHEIALHTHSHPHGEAYSIGAWLDEIERNIDPLVRPWDPAETPERPNPDSGLGLPRDTILGFRAPFVEYNDNALTAVGLAGLTYDASIEEAFQGGPDPAGFVWPYRLDLGRPGSRPPVGPHPGLWEVPICDFIAPPDDLCPSYGLGAGLRARLKTVQDYFVPDYGGITGMDWNLWNEFHLSPAEFLAVLKYTLDRHLEGNRCPMIVGLHGDLYSDKAHGEDSPAPAARRRAVLIDFLDYALQKPEVRVVNIREFLKWLSRPSALR